ncbi:MAG: tetratricopeptide repeat protein [Planctomycetota bacterium]|nr:tetratricopeptide repeat protein [Planctomycetota bacterium]
MDAQIPAPAQEANVSAGSGPNQNLGAPTDTGELDLSAIEGGLFGGRRRLKQTLSVTGLAVTAILAGWIAYRATSSVPQEASSALEVNKPAATTRPADDIHPQVQTGESEAPPASWTEAERAFAEKQFSRALEQYRRLAAMTATTPGRAAIHELFLLRAADCLQKTGTAEDYRCQLDQVAQATSPVVFSLANYRLAALDCQQELWLQGRTRAYRALGAGGLTGPAEPFAAECRFLIARCLTQELLKLTGVKAEVGWSELELPDPISQWEERQLIEAIMKGGEMMSTATLGPRFEKTPGAVGSGASWQVTCWRTPLEQVLGRFAHESGVNVEWSSVAPAARQRAVTLLGAPMNQRRLLETAAGAAGLLARSDGATVKLYDLGACDSFAQQQQVLASEAVSTWTHLVLAGGEGPRAAEGQFALGLLRECTGDLPAAVPELRQVALRFPRSRVAPYALMRSARTNMALRDFASAQDDLTNLMNTYPEHPEMENVFLLLAKACAESSRPAEAAALFKKVYLLDRSAETKAEAALAAGRNCYRTGAHADAVQWLERYLAAVKAGGHAEIPSAYLMMARSRLAMGEIELAVRAMQQCLANRPGIDTEREALIELAKTNLKQENLVGAVVACRRAGETSPTPADRDEIVALQAQIDRKMGLAEKAVRSLEKHLAGRAEDPKALSLWLELARCHRDSGAAGEAYRLLGELLVKAKNDADAEPVKCELADLAVKLQKGKQAIVLMEDVLKTTKDAAVRRRCYQTLAAAHVAEKDYEKAAQVMAANAGTGPGGGPK